MNTFLYPIGAAKIEQKVKNEKQKDKKYLSSDLFTMIYLLSLKTGCSLLPALIFPLRFRLPETYFQFPLLLCRRRQI